MPLNDACKKKFRYADYVFDNEMRYARNITTDPHKTQRLSVRECQACYYELRLAGQAFTKYVCLNCEQTFSWHNTNVPILCFECAKENDVCSRCGCHVNYG